MSLFVFPPVSLSINAGPVAFRRDGSTQNVTEDTVDSSNTIGLPVQIVGSDGTTVNLTAGDINIQSQHDGANPDSIRIGDGTEELSINASNEALVHDQDVHDKLDTLNAKDFATETTLASINSKDFATQATLLSVLNKLIAAPSTEAKQDSVISALGNLLTELQAKADLSETQPVSMSSQPLPTGAATETTLEAARALLASIAGKDFATETTLSALSGKLPTIGQKTSAGSVAVALSTEQEAMIDGIEASLTALEADNARLDVVDQVDGNILDTGTTSIPANSGGFQEIVASLASDVKEIQVIDDMGAFVGLYTGAAASEAFLCVLPQGFTGSKLPVQIPAGTRLSVRSMTSSAINAGNLAINFLG